MKRSAAQQTIFDCTKSYVKRIQYLLIRKHDNIVYLANNTPHILWYVASWLQKLSLRQCLFKRYTSLHFWY